MTRRKVTNQVRRDWRQILLVVFSLLIILSMVLSMVLTVFS